MSDPHAGNGGTSTEDPATDEARGGGHAQAQGNDGNGANPEVTHNPERDPADWVTGGEPSTGAQESYLSTLAKEAGEETPTGLTKAEASQEIERLQAETGRGAGT